MLGFASNMQFGFDQAAKNKHLDVAALDKLIKLLEKMRDAMFNLELCIEADFNKTPGTEDDGSGLVDKSVGIHDNGYGNLIDSIRGKNTNNGNIVYPTDREITAFIVNRLGESPSFAQQVLVSAKAGSDLDAGLATGSPDNAGGSDATANLRMAIGDCARTLNAGKIEDLAKLIADWEII
jgi:hypothetical protein